MHTSPSAWAVGSFSGISFDGTLRDLLGDFESYIRVFNPAHDPTAPPGTDSRSWARAGTPATVVTADTQWSDLQVDPVLDEPTMGDLDTDVAVRLASVLGRHTTTPDECAFLLWTGYAEVESLDSAPVIRAGQRTDLAVFSGPIAAAVQPQHGRRPMNWRPRDRAWALGNDIYARSVYIGADSATVRAIRDSPHLETALASGSAILTPEDRRG
ncbi:hypothetical protein ACI2IX_05585 [Leifsonia aquatica]|uniref:hypothetical protein n=1 Tax=Leifsonia aquatica TaxID=144185 RepID=UPI00384DFC0A